ncbi:hypothetical protein [Variovorax sp. GB1P17]|uniref:hypothetical protein n=1 Tax=Variovorax sp. GB1P17 TaxID=3443740 RepID=UPI003F4560AB
MSLTDKEINAAAVQGAGESTGDFVAGVHWAIAALASREEAPPPQQSASTKGPALSDAAIDDVIQIVRNVYGGWPDHANRVHAEVRARARVSILAALTAAQPADGKGAL